MCERRIQPREETRSTSVDVAKEGVSSKVERKETGHTWNTEIIKCYSRQVWVQGCILNPPHNQIINLNGWSSQVPNQLIRACGVASLLLAW
jgi:hypothetical protein